MKYGFLAFSFVLVTFCTQAFAGNYKVTIDGKVHEVDLGQVNRIVLEDGREIEVVVDKKDVLSFEVDNFSFDYPSAFKPTRTDVGDGIYQTMMATPLGSLVLVQEYTTLDPSHMVDMMVKELTKEEEQYGYQIETSAVTKVVNGTSFTGKKAIARYKADKSTRFVFAHGARDSGLMVITMVDKDAPAEDIAMIQKFWESLTVTMQ
ncbi:MAG: hypothetical protein ACRBCK_00555 [Alphaproteobacteria bacterium]